MTGWGIVGTGWIAKEFAAALRRVPDAELVAVGSRSEAKVAAFADTFNIAGRHSSLHALLQDDAVDVLYIALPASEHHAAVLAAAEAGKHVLVEKPFATDGLQAKEMVQAAQAAGIFLMEAMWSRFLPAYAKMHELIADGRIGEVLGCQATMGMRVSDRLPSDDRMLDPARGGGGLLDVGVYPLQLFHSLLGEPTEIAALATVGPTGVDLDLSAVLRFTGERLAHLQTSMSTRLPNTAHVFGSLGWIELPAPQQCPEEVVLQMHPATWSEQPTLERFATPIGGDGLRYQVLEVHRCLDEGLTESATMPWQDSIAIMESVDRIRLAGGLT